MGFTELHFDVNMSDGTGAQIPARLDCETRYWSDGGFSHRTCRINLKYGGDAEIEATAEDFFEALC